MLKLSRPKVVKVLIEGLQNHERVISQPRTF